MPPFTLTTLLAALQLHGPGATIVSAHPGIDAVLAEVRSELEHRQASGMSNPAAERHAAYGSYQRAYSRVFGPQYAKYTETYSRSYERYDRTISIPKRRGDAPKPVPPLKDQ
jgi:hypothetical protein